MMNLVISLSMSQLLNESQQLRKKFAWNLQSSISRYRIRKSSTKKAMNEAMMKALAITTRTLKDDEDIASMFIITWVKNIRVIWSLIDNDSIIKIISKRLMNRISLMKIKHDENLSMTLTIDHKTTLKKYVWISINCQEVEIYMKIYVCLIIVYDLLLGLRWQKRVQMKIDMSKKIMSITEINEKKRMIQTQLIFKEVLTQMSIMKIKNAKNFDEKKTLQAIIDEEKKELKNRRWRVERFVSAKIRAR